MQWHHPLSKANVAMKRKDSSEKKENPQET